MNTPTRILLQTTIPATEDDWNIGRFSRLHDHLSSLADSSGAPLFEVTGRNLERSGDGADPVLSRLDVSDFDQLWLFAVDTGDGLNSDECGGITRFRQRGGGLLTTRDHQDLGSSLCTLGGVGAAHFFHSKNQEPDAARHIIDDPDNPAITWPNYHSGANGDFQRVEPAEPIHEIFLHPGASPRPIEMIPAHPHEGAVGVPAGEGHARVIATGRSKVTGTPFNLMIAFDASPDEHGNMLGRAIADSSFHHFVDYNWDPSLGAPSFVTEPPGDGMRREPRATADTLAFARNIALWLAPTAGSGA
ncbi:MAG: hypothetical protein JWQ98_2006 [Chlorobi bacterium]|nr:hypothetical protein [Chlorobiota bacterium]